jgi:hypothetical protein
LTRVEHAKKTPASMLLKAGLSSLNNNNNTLFLLSANNINIIYDTTN